MKLARLYANSANCKLQKPFINTQFYPVSVEKYIVLHSGGGNDKFPAKIYDLWQNVVNLIKPFLDLHGIQIIQLGLGNERPLNNVINLLGQTNIHQSAYIIQNSMFLAGNDSSLAHIAGALNIDVLSVYGPTGEPHEPFWRTPNSIFLHPHRFGNKNPSFQAQEHPKTINLIPPELIAKNILSILNIENNINQNTILAGEGYAAHATEIHLIPDAILNPESINAPQIHLRADLLFDLNYIIGNLQRRKYILWLDREMDIEILKQLKPNIENILYRVEEDTDINYLNKIVKVGLNLNLYTKLSAEEFNPLKLKYLDLPIVNINKNFSLDEIKEMIKKYLNEKELKNDDFFRQNIKYLSRKHYLSNGKIYNSLMDYKKSISVNNVENFSIANFNDQDFLNQIPYFLMYLEE